MRHDIIVALVTLVASVAVNVIIYAVVYAHKQGELEQRVEALEKNRAEIREDWKAARERIERYLKGQ